MIRKLLFATAVLVAAPAFAAMPPAQFLQHAIKGDNSEVRLGRLISHLGASAQVRRFGATLTSDHSVARSQAAALARRMGVRPPTAMTPDARVEYARLSHLRGRAFDREVRRSMIADHRKDIAAFDEGLCDQQIEGAEKWLRRLGFTLDEQMTTDPKHPIWRCDLSI